MVVWQRLLRPSFRTDDTLSAAGCRKQMAHLKRADINVCLSQSSLVFAVIATERLTPHIF